MRPALALLVRLPLLAALAACGSGDRPAPAEATLAQVPATPAVTSPPLPPASATARLNATASAPGVSSAAVTPPASQTSAASDRVLTSASPLAPAPARDVNPLTGMPLSLEEMHWSLEQAHLEEQLQASLLNRRKFELERLHLDATEGTAGAVSLLQGPGSGVAAPARRPDATAGAETHPADGLPIVRGGPASNADASRRRPATTQRAAPAASDRDRWTVVGVRAQGSVWCLLLLEGEQLVPACAGETRQGRHIDAVSAQGYSVDGHAFLVTIPVARVRRAGAAAEAESWAGTGETALPMAADSSVAVPERTFAATALAPDPVATGSGQAGAMAASEALATGFPAPDRWPAPAGSDASSRGPRSLVSTQTPPH